MAAYLLPEDELTEEFVRPAAGNGGQHLNKTSNAVRLSFDYLNSESLPEPVKERLTRTGGSAVSGGNLVILEKGSRSLQQNRDMARARMTALIEAAFVEPKKRKKTKATHASQLKRLEKKSRRSDVKTLRKKPSGE